MRPNLSRRQHTNTSNFRRLASATSWSRAGRRSFVPSFDCVCRLIIRSRLFEGCKSLRIHSCLSLPPMISGFLNCVDGHGAVGGRHNMYRSAHKLVVVAAGCVTRQNRQGGRFARCDSLDSIQVKILRCVLTGGRRDEVVVTRVVTNGGSQQLHPAFPARVGSLPQHVDTTARPQETPNVTHYFSPGACPSGGATPCCPTQRRRRDRC